MQCVPQLTAVQSFGGQGAQGRPFAQACSLGSRLGVARGAAATLAPAQTRPERDVGSTTLDTADNREV